ncbi:MAG: hypothetical protein LBG12_02420 [Synergistaceae bacterium]|nr:hypothetical protein [Synergistaceae bacterium]
MPAGTVAINPPMMSALASASIMLSMQLIASLSPSVSPDGIFECSVWRRAVVMSKFSVC